MSVKLLKELFTRCTQNVQFLCNGWFYRQIDHVAMGSPLDPFLANVFIGKIEKTSLRETINDLEFYCRCTDDIFCETDHNTDVDVVVRKFNSAHPSLKVSAEAKVWAVTCDKAWQRMPYIKDVSEATKRIAAGIGVGIAHHPKATVRSRVMRIKDRLNPSEQSSVVHRIPCLYCPVNYTGRTGRMLGSRIHEHKSAVRQGDALSQVCIGEDKSEWVDVVSEVPQGSVLGPL
ncbi:unnamed protein product, partial [Dibothriocephalus latus]